MATPSANRSMCRSRWSMSDEHPQIMWASSSSAPLPQRLQMRCSRRKPIHRPDSTPNQRDPVRNCTSRTRLVREGMN